MVRITINWDDIPDLPLSISPGKYISKDGDREIILEVKGIFCPVGDTDPFSCARCPDYPLGMCGIWFPTAPSQSQKIAFRKLITELQEA